MSGDIAALPYHEPDVVTILTQSSFLLILNVVNYALDRLIYCGLIGQMLVGIAWGVPGSSWLPETVQEATVQLGYLGLILLVYEGGLATSFTSLKANALFSSSVAITGIALPVALSFALIPLTQATPLQAFAAGAALCSTSLGTTFAILQVTNLNETKLGVVLTSAAMMDDVVGLVMVQVISNLGAKSIDAVTVVRPIIVSAAFAVALVLVCRFIVKPCMTKVLSAKISISESFKTFHFAFLFHTCVLFGLVAGASYAGTSNLFAAYLAGASISWWDSELQTSMSQRRGANASINHHSEHGGAVELSAFPSRPGEATGMMDQSVAQQSIPQKTDSKPKSKNTNSSAILPTGVSVYERYYAVPVNTILKPLFFASLGFAIPITDMFPASTVWRGLVYTVLMVFGKVLTGLCLVRLSFDLRVIANIGKRVVLAVPRFCTCRRKKIRFRGKNGKSESPRLQTEGTQTTAGIHDRDDSRRQERPATTDSNAPSLLNPRCSSSPANGNGDPGTSSSPPPAPSSPRCNNHPVDRDTIASSSSTPPKPRSLNPAAILGMAMVARGEIGFLIASLAESSGVFGTSDRGPEIYLIVIWAITLCTVVGPLSVGTLVRRVKKLQAHREVTGGSDPLGVWGVSVTVSEA